MRVAGESLFQLLGQSDGYPLVDENDISIMLRTWRAHNLLIIVVDMKGSTP